VRRHPAPRAAQDYFVARTAGGARELKMARLSTPVFTAISLPIALFFSARLVDGGGSGAAQGPTPDLRGGIF